MVPQRPEQELPSAILHLESFPQPHVLLVSRVGPGAFDNNSFNDRAHKHVYNFQRNRDIITLKNLGQPRKQSCKSHFPSFSYIIFQPTTKQHPPQMREM